VTFKEINNNHYTEIIHLKDIKNKSDQTICIAHEGLYLEGLWEATEVGDTIINLLIH